MHPQHYLPLRYLTDGARFILIDSWEGVGRERIFGYTSTGNELYHLKAKAVDASIVRLVRTNVGLIMHEMNFLLTDHKNYKKINQTHNRYGDGSACPRILDLFNFKSGTRNNAL